MSPRNPDVVYSRSTSLPSKTPEEKLHMMGLEPQNSTKKVELSLTNIQEKECTIILKWKRSQDTDTEFEYRKWDFVALHKQGTGCHEYLSSRYLLHSDEQSIALCTPPVSGVYHASVVRDMNLVYRLMKFKKEEATRIQEFKKHIDSSQDEHLVALDTVTFTVEKSGTCDYAIDIPLDHCDSATS